MQHFKGFYRAYFKQRLKLCDMPVSSCKVLEFDINYDLLASTSNSFVFDEIPSEVSLGDVIIVTDSFGIKRFTGVIDEIEENKIVAQDIFSLFNDEILMKIGTNTGMYTEKIKYYVQQYSLQNDDDHKITSLVSQFDFDCQQTTKKYTIKRTEVATVNIYDEMLKIYNTGCVVSIDVSLKNERPIIKSKYIEDFIYKIADNSVYTPTMKPIIQMAGKNKLTIYNENATQKRGTYYLTENGIVTNSRDLTRTDVVKTSIVTSDEDLQSLKNSYLDNFLYNHKIEIEMILDNKLYDFSQMILGGKFQLYIGKKYFNTVLTGYSLSKTENEDCKIVKLVFGKVRNKFSQRFFL